MKRAIFVLADGIEVHQKVVSSLSHAAARWKCDFILARNPLEPGIHPYWQKVFAHRHLSGYDQVAQVDADMLFHISAPPIFDFVPVESFGAVRDYNEDLYPTDDDTPKRIRTASWQRSFLKAVIRKWKDIAGHESSIGLDEYINAGLLVYSPKRHASIFEKVESVGRKSGWLGRYLPEQTCLSLELQHHDHTWLHPGWNMHPAGWMPALSRPKMRSWGYHFTGKHKMRRIDRVWWRAGLDRSPLTEGACRGDPEFLPADYS